MPPISLGVSAQELLKRFALIYLPIAIALSVVLFAGIRFDEQLRVETTEIGERSRIEVAKERIVRDLSAVDTDLRVITKLPLLRRYLDSAKPAQRMELEKLFLNLAMETRRYDQIRYLDANGQEIVRINYNDGKPAIVPPGQLQNKSERYYFSDTFKLNQGEIFVSPLDLNVEGGSVEAPYKPMIRYGTPVFDSAGRKKGIILLNYFGNELLQGFRSAMQGGKQHSGMLLNRDGYWLQSADRGDEWGFMLGKSERTFGHDFPEVWRAISAAGHGSLLTERGLFVYTTVSPLSAGERSSTGSAQAHARSQQEITAHEYNWKIVSFVPHAALSGDAFYNQLLGRILFAIVYLLLALAAYLVARVVLNRKQAQMALVTAKEQAELANRAKDSFLATMSHEIRTPLTGMLGMLELLSLTTLDNEQHATLDAAWGSGRGLLRIVNDILDWSKIEEGKLELSPHATSISQLLQEVVNTYSRVASAKSLVLWQYADPRLGSAHIVDPLRLSQVLNNFVSNAIKFTPSGEVELRAELLEQRDSGEKVCFSVRDTGTGIARDAQQHLFQRYRQEGPDTARMYGGTGLGLAICRRLAELMDGQIGLESEPGHGSTFSITLTLPVSDIPSETVRTHHPEVEQRKVVPLFDNSTDAPLVLAVDDHPINRDLLARQIALLGLRAETAENGKAALSMWRDGRFALVITDCHMPEMDGYEFSQAVRKTEAEEGLPHTPIVAWTANALAEETEHCRAAGMDELLVKPANLKQLREILAKTLSVTGTDKGQSVSSSSGDTGNPQITGPIDFAQLETIIADPAEHMQVLHDFQSHMRTDHAKLLELLEQGDQLDVENTAHRMKGSSRMVGAKGLGDACAAIEEAARNGDMAGARSARAALDEAFTQLETFLVEEERNMGEKVNERQ